MTDDELVEKVARAMMRAADTDGMCWCGYDSEDRDSVGLERHRAHIAIAAVREHCWVYDEPVDFAEYGRGFEDGQASLAAAVERLADEWEATQAANRAALAIGSFKMRAYSLAVEEVQAMLRARADRIEADNA